MQYPDYLLKEPDYPSFYRVSMNWPRKGLTDVEAALIKTLDSALENSEIKNGDSVALCVGSRGIANLSLMVKIICNKLQSIGANPYIIPAMGSHGNADAKGQTTVLEHLDISEKSCCSPITSSMDVINFGNILDDIPIWFSKDASEMDHTIFLNRIKPHTKFKGPVESGLFKMLCIGMGKHKGAEACHQAALRHGFSPVIKAAGELILKKTNIRFGIAVIEDHYDDTMTIEAIQASQLYNREAELLLIAKENFPKLPIKKLDALIIQKIGKDISGSGMDPNVTGRTYDLMEDDFSTNMHTTRLAILDMTEKTDGNAIGLGNADIITEKVFQKLDYQKTLTNALTSISLRKAFIPVRLPDDRMVIQAACTTAGLKDIKKIRAAIIKDTLNLDEFWVSEPLLKELNDHSEVSIEEEVELVFDSSGNLIL